jgi:hypothetical protein
MILSSHRPAWTRNCTEKLPVRRLPTRVGSFDPQMTLGSHAAPQPVFRLLAVENVKGPAVASDKETEAIKKHLTFTAELAGKILLSPGYDSHDAFIKAAGPLAQVINLIAPDDQREQALTDAMWSLKMYLKLLDELVGPILPSKPSH